MEIQDLCFGWNPVGEMHKEGDGGAPNWQRYFWLSDTQISPDGGYTDPTADGDMEAANDALLNSRSLKVSIQTLDVGYCQKK